MIADREAKVAEARRRVLDGGETPQAVAESLGVGRSTLYQWVWPERYGEDRPERRAQKRRWEREHAKRAVCPCGAALGMDSMRRAGRLCRECERDVRAVGRAMREERVFELWSAGKSTADVARALGYAGANGVGAVLAKMRRNGWDVPYRRNWPSELRAKP